MLLLWFLGLAAVALLALLIWLLWPEGGAPAPEAGYPIEVVTTIYGYGEAPDQLLRTPLGVAFDGQGHVWISNTGQSRVEQYTTDGSLVGVICVHEPGKLFSPYGVAVDPDAGRVYVADYGAGFVQVYSTPGQYVATSRPTTRSRGSSARRSPVRGRDGRGRIVVSSNDGLYSRCLAVGESVGLGPRGRQRPWTGLRAVQPNAFAVDPDSGTTYGRHLNRRVVAINREGVAVGLGPPTQGESRASGSSRGINRPDGNVYVVDTFRADDKGVGTGYFVVLSPDGELLSEFGRSGLTAPSTRADRVRRTAGLGDADREQPRRDLPSAGAVPAPEIEAEKYAGAVSAPSTRGQRRVGEEEIATGIRLNRSRAAGTRPKDPPWRIDRAAIMSSSRRSLVSSARRCGRDNSG
jgi:DNA-binding beta-propeller fold protein YncE